MRPSIGNEISNLPKRFGARFDHRSCLKTFLMQKNFVASATAIFYYVVSSLKNF